MKMLVTFILVVLPNLAFALQFEKFNLALMTGKQAEEWLMVAIGLTGTAFLGVLLALFIRRKKVSRLSSREFYSVAETVAEKTEEPSFSSLAPYENEMSLRLTLAQHYLEVEDRENALALLEEVRWRGQKPERDLAEKLLNEFHLK